MNKAWCTCSRSKTDGYTHIGNGIWVHQPCMKPSRVFWERVLLAKKVEDELDIVIERLIEGHGDEQDKGRAEICCLVLAWIDDPDHPNIVKFKDEAVKRYRDKEKSAA